MKTGAEERLRAYLRHSGDGLGRGVLDALLGWARSQSLSVHAFVSHCCEPEMEALSGPRYDLERFGCDGLHNDPRRSDLLIVGGTISHARAVWVRKIYDRMQEPKWVMALGSCACSGAPYENYATLPGIGVLLPVDIYVPGCPPRPEAVLDGLLKLQARIRLERVGPQGRRGAARRALVVGARIDPLRCDEEEK